MRERELIAHGLSVEEARRVARDAFGDVNAVQQTCVQIDEDMLMDRSLMNWYGSLVQDVRFGARGLRRNPGFTLVAVLIVALGIGGNALIFSLVEAMLLRAPAVRDAASLVAVWTTSRRGDAHAASSFPDYIDYRDRSTRLSDMAAYAPFSLTLGAVDSQAELVGAELVTGNFFDVLGLVPAHGRLLQSPDNAPGGDHALVVISHAYWHTRFGGAPDLVGRTVQLNGLPYEIVGVAPEGFGGLVLGQVPELWLPLRGLPALFPTSFDASLFERRSTRWIKGLVARLRDGATVEQARTEMLAISDQLFAEDSLARGPRRVTVESVPRRLLQGGDDALASFLGVLQGVVALTLLLACANLANLLLARAASRRSETAVRLALGVGRARLLRQLFTESVLLAVLGGVVALAMTAFALRLVASVELPMGSATLGTVDATLNPPVILFTLGLALLTGVLFGLLPAAAAARSDVALTLREARGGDTVRSMRLRRALVALQLALGVILLVGAGLFVRTLQNRLAVDLGFPTRGLAMISVDPTMNRYSPERADALIAQLVERASALPGVRAASAGLTVPVRAGGMATMLTVEGYLPAADEEMRVEFTMVAPGYLSTLGLPLVAGREISAADANSNARVVVIDETAAERWWLGRDPIGTIVRLSGEDDPGFTVIGVARRSAWGEPDVGSEPYAFLSMAHAPNPDLTTILARTTSSDATALLPALRDLVRQIDPGLAIVSAGTMDEEIAATFSQQRAAAWLLSAFGVLALTLAAVGIYGVMSYTVEQRRRDLGVRKALGASDRDVARLVARGMLGPSIIGLGVGLIVARLLASSLDSLVYGISIADTATYAFALVVLGGVAACATVLPARRAAATDPVEVMRG